MAEETGPGMSGGEPDSHAFVLRVWREEGGRRARWRGHITHVASGTRRSLLRLGEIGLFVGGYLAQMGVAMPLLWRIRRWLGRPARRPPPDGERAPLPPAAPRRRGRGRGRY